MMIEPQVRVAKAAAYTLYMSQRAVFEKALGKSDDRVRELTKQWAGGLRSVIGVEVKAHGFENIDWSQPYVVMANHQSYLDVLALYSALPKTFGIVAKKQLFSIPFFSGVMRALGCVSVDRTDKSGSVEAMRTAAEQVRAGSTIAVFPEGTRSAGDRVGKLKKGAFHLAQVAQVPIVPVGIRGTHQLMPRANSAIYPGVVEVFAGAPIKAPPANDAAGRNKTIAEVRAAIAKLAGLPLAD
jgi:1-acyl-sn-glycerol-3-phosphate acyltransferase